MKLEELKTWIKGQLTQTKSKEQSWADLATALAHGIHEHVEGLLDRIKSRNSLYDMNHEDLLLETEELRTVLPIPDSVSEEDLPHVIMRRQDEIHFKRTVYPLIATIAREFAGMNVTWEPLYAPCDLKTYPYGELFITRHELDNYLSQGMTKDDFFMTSRGVIRVPINDVAGGSNGVTEESIATFEARVRRFIYPLIPLRIVCDGQSYFISISMTDIVEFINPMQAKITGLLNTEEESDATQNKPNAITALMTTTDETKASPMYGTPRMDSVPCDAIILDRRYY